MVEGSIKTQDDFNKAYDAYVWLARHLAVEAGADRSIDTQSTVGTKAHRYTSLIGHGSDHVSHIGVDEIKKVNGIWQMINYDLAGGRDFNWTYSGIPLTIVDNVTRDNQAATRVGDLVIFK